MRSNISSSLSLTVKIKTLPNNHLFSASVINIYIDAPSTLHNSRIILSLLGWTFAAILAKTKNARHIVTGVCETDFSGYPDCRDVFVKSLNVTANLAMDYDFVMHTPLMWLDKAQTWELADKYGKLEYVREKTLTCYNGIIGDGCGECPSCKLRQHGLETYLKQKEELNK